MMSSSSNRRSRLRGRGPVLSIHFHKPPTRKFSLSLHAQLSEFSCVSFNPAETSEKFVMPELPEVEILVRHLAPLIKTAARSATLMCVVQKSSLPHRAELKQALQGATFKDLTRRGKYLLFTLRPARRRRSTLLARPSWHDRPHVSAPKKWSLAQTCRRRHGPRPHKLVYEDTRYFGRLTLDTRACTASAPNLWPGITVEYFAAALQRPLSPSKLNCSTKPWWPAWETFMPAKPFFAPVFPPASPAN